MILKISLTEPQGMLRCLIFLEIWASVCLFINVMLIKKECNQMVWDILPEDSFQRVSGKTCTSFGVLLFLSKVMSIWNFKEKKRKASWIVPFSENLKFSGSKQSVSSLTEIVFWNRNVGKFFQLCSNLSELWDRNAP